MLLSKLLGERLKEKPAEAKIVSQVFLMRGGYIKYVANGLYTLLMPAKIICRKIEEIIRQEMNRIDGQEVSMPVVLPRELWNESGRYQSIGKELARFKDRSDRDMLLAMTHEEAALQLIRDDVSSYARFPFMLYQIQTKFRDEPRCKGGLIRLREFIMKDAYSFHTSQEDLEEYYQKCYHAYRRIFERMGIPEVVSVASDSGMMGGKVTNEFMLLCDAGEDYIAVCPECGLSQNVEVANTVVAKNETERMELKETATPDTRTIEELEAFFKTDKSRFIKSCVFAMENSDKAVVAFIRGDYEVNEAKLEKAAGARVFPLENKTADLVFGYIGPVGLNTKNIITVYDNSLNGEQNLISGANKEGYHLSGICLERDVNPKEYHDILKVKEGDVCHKCGGRYNVSKGIEVGHIFQLGKKYTESMSMTYLDENGERKIPTMGCYGIGVSRSIAAVLEARHDDYGPIWPFAVAPWHIHINVLAATGEMKRAAQGLYERLKADGYEVIMDDRNVSAGIQFADADLLGVPYRIVFGKKNFENGLAEIAARDKSMKATVEINKIYEYITNIIEKEKSKI